MIHIEGGKYTCPDCGSANVIYVDNCKGKFVTKIVGVIEVWNFKSKKIIFFLIWCYKVCT